MAPFMCQQHFYIFRFGTIHAAVSIRLVVPLERFSNLAKSSNIGKYNCAGAEWLRWARKGLRWEEIHAWKPYSNSFE